MKSRYAILLLLIVCISTSGCTPARRIGEMCCMTAKAVPLFAAEAFFNSLTDGDPIGSETFHERIAREERNEAWKGYWRANADRFPKMAEAYSKD